MFRFDLQCKPLGSDHTLVYQKNKVFCTSKSSVYYYLHVNVFDL